MGTADPTLVFLVLTSTLYAFIIGVILVRRGLREWDVGLLVLYVVISLLWTLGRVFSRLSLFPLFGSDVVARVLLYGFLLISWLFLHLSRSFLRFEEADRNWWALGVAWIAMVVVLNENLLALPEVLWAGNGWLVERQKLAFGTLVSGWGVFMGGATLLTARVYHRTQQPLHRNRITYWSFPLGLTVAGAALFLAGREALGSGFHLLGTLSAVYAMLTYRLPDVRRMARRMVSYFVITLLAMITYTAGFMATQYVFQSVPGYSPLLAGAVMALVLAIFFDPLRGLAQRLVNRLVSGIGYEPSYTLREYSMSISNILGLERLAKVAVGLIAEAMEIRRGALLVVHYEKGENGEKGGNGYFRLRGVRGFGKVLPPGILSAEGSVADYLCREHRPLTQYDVDLLPRFRETPLAERAWLASLDMDVYVPIYAKGEWIGLLALGSKISGDRYFDGDLILLSTLADQTAVALENARLFDDLKIRSAEIEHLNEELTVANRELARLDQVKSDFIDIASHELRTPLTQVRGFNDVLDEMIGDGSLTPDTGLRLTQGAKKAVQRLEEIVNTMFDVSHTDTETLALKLLPTSVVSTVSAAVDTWTTVLEERKQTLTVEGLTDLPTIIADSKRLEQVFSNLIQNAIKFTPDGGQVRITGRLLGEEMPPEEQAIEVVVADNGIGIAPDDLERIFEKFCRVGDVMLHSTGKTKFKGAGPGLGLTLVRGLVGAHGGRVWAESPGHDEETCPGSEFHAVLPVQPRSLESMGSEAFIVTVRADTDQAWRTVS